MFPFTLIFSGKLALVVFATPPMAISPYEIPPPDLSKFFYSPFEKISYAPTIPFVDMLIGPNEKQFIVFERAYQPNRIPQQNYGRDPPVQGNPRFVNT